MSSGQSDEHSRNSKEVSRLFEDSRAELVLFENQVVETSKGLVSTSNLEQVGSSGRRSRTESSS